MQENINRAQWPAPEGAVTQAGLLPGRRRFARALAASFVLASQSLRAAEQHITLGISMNLVPHVNLIDARASIQVWLDWSNKAHNMPVKLTPGVFVTSRDLVGMIRLGRIDAFAMDVNEYRQVANHVDARAMIGADFGPARGEEYVLVVRRDSGVRHLADLKGKRLLRLKSPLTPLAAEWLAASQARQGVPPGLAFWGSSVVETKLSRVVLPVFFQQADACLVTRRGFNTMSEMNPQIGERLRILLVSPPMSAAGYFFRKGCPESARERMMEAFTNLHRVSYGQKLLVLFQTPRLTRCDLGGLKQALDLVREYEALNLAPGPDSDRGRR